MKIRKTYFDRNGVEIRAGMFIQSPSGQVCRVFETTDVLLSEDELVIDLGISATNPKYAQRHPYEDQEYYSLNTIGVSEWEVYTEGR